MINTFSFSFIFLQTKRKKYLNIEILNREKIEASSYSLMLTSDFPGKSLNMFSRIGKARKQPSLKILNLFNDG